MRPIFQPRRSAGRTCELSSPTSVGWRKPPRILALRSKRQDRTERARRRAEPNYLARGLLRSGALGAPVSGVAEHNPARQGDRSATGKDGQRTTLTRSASCQRPTRLGDHRDEADRAGRAGRGADLAPRPGARTEGTVFETRSRGSPTRRSPSPGAASTERRVEPSGHAFGYIEQTDLWRFKTATSTAASRPCSTPLSIGNDGTIPAVLFRGDDNQAARIYPCWPTRRPRTAATRRMRIVDADGVAAGPGVVVVGAQRVVFSVTSMTVR